MSKEVVFLKYADLRTCLEVEDYNILICVSTYSNRMFIIDLLDFSMEIISPNGGCTGINTLIKISKNEIAYAGDKTERELGRGYDICLLSLNVENYNLSNITKYFEGHNDSVEGLVKINRNTMVSVSEDRSAKVWDITKKESVTPLQSLDVGTEEGGGLSCCYQEPYLIVGGYNYCFIFTKNSNENKFTRAKKIRIGGPIESLVSISSRRFAIGTRAFVRFMQISKETKNEKMEIKVDVYHKIRKKGRTMSLFFVDPSILFISGEDNVYVCDVEKRRIIHNYHDEFHGTLICSVTINHKGELIAGGWGSDVYVLRSQYIPHHEEEIERRVEFLLSNKFYNFEVTLGNFNDNQEKGKIRLFKSWLLSPTIDLNRYKKVIFPEWLNVEEEKVIKVLLGAPYHLPYELYFDYFCFFHFLNMREISFLICKEIELIDDDDILMKLFEKSKRYYTDIVNNTHYISIKNEEISVKQIIHVSNDTTNPFFLSLVHELNNRKTFMGEKGNFFITHEKIFKNKKREFFLPNEVDFSLESDLETLNLFNQIPRRREAKLVREKRYSNLSISSKTDKVNTFGKKRTNIKCHVELLTLKGDFFFMMLKFAGKEQMEAKKEKKIEILGLDYNAVRGLIDFCYYGHIRNTGFDVLFQLLNHAHMYLEKVLESYVLKLIRNESDRLSKIVSFKKSGVETLCGHIKNSIHVLDKNINKEKLIRVWESMGVHRGQYEEIDEFDEEKILKKIGSILRRREEKNSIYI